MDPTTALTVPAEARFPFRVAVGGTPEELELFDALAAATRRLAAQRMVAA
jgi:hypothetical protein